MHACAEWCIVCFVGNPPKLIDILPALLLALAVREKVKFPMVAPARRSQSTSSLTASPSRKGKGKVPYGGSSRRSQSTSSLTATLLLALAVRERVKFPMVAPARSHWLTSDEVPASLSKVKTSSTSNLFSLLSSTPTSNPSAERDASPAHSLHSPEDAGPRVLVNVSDSPAKPDGNIWIVKLELYYTDKAILESSDKWLNDSIVCAAAL